MRITPDVAKGHDTISARRFGETLSSGGPARRVSIGSSLERDLLKIDSSEQVTALQRQFLVASGLHALCALSDGKITQGEFRPLAEQEQAARIEEASAKAVKDAAERAACEETKAAAIKETFAAMANDPVLRRKREARELRQRFGIGYVESEDYPRVMALLRQVANRQRLKAEDVAWLKTEADDCWTFVEVGQHDHRTR